jgi:DNA-binding XRE family transcriptional regulator
MAQAKQSKTSLSCSLLELDGVRYVVVREAVFEQLCRKAKVVPQFGQPAGAELTVDGRSLAEKLKQRRRSTGLSQAKLARRAGIRPETLNRIERGKTTPDFATIRKLVNAMNAAEREAADL